MRSILFNQPRIFTVSSVITKRFGLDDVALSLPTIIRRNGICEKIDVKLSEQELGLLVDSGNCIKEGINKVLKV